MKYIGLLSEVLDVMHQNQADVDLYVKIAKRYSGKILELGSGSGRISLELANEGYDVTCLEIHRDMVYLHEERLTEKTRNNTKIVLGDMCSFDLDEKFDLIIAPHNVIAHIMNPVEFLEMLISVKKHLSAAGVFVIEAPHPNEEAMKVLHGVEQNHQFINPRSGYTVIDKITPFFNFSTHSELQRIVATEFKESRINRRVEIIQESKFWYPDEIKEFLQAAQLSLIMESGSLDQIEPLTDNSEHMVFYIK